MEKDLYKFIRLFLLFLPVSLLSYLILALFWGEYIPQKFQENLTYPIATYGHMYTRLKEVKHTKDVDLLILGSSHAYRSFDTRIFEKNRFKCFNLGSSTQTPLQSEVLLKRYLKPLNPKIVIYEVFPGIFSSDGVESSLDIIANDKNDEESIKMAFEINHLKVYNTLIYAFYRDFFDKNKDYNENIRKEDDLYIKGGYVEKKVKFFKKMTHPQSQWQINPYQLKAFKEVVKILKDRNIKLYLVQAPVTKSLYNSISGNREFDKLMCSYGEYYNFNEHLQLNDSLNFYDAHHLNKYGVDIFNKKILESILTHSKCESYPNL
jgi:hypothetical protein